MQKAVLLLLVVALSAVACRKEGGEDTAGKKRFTTNVDGDTREYYVHEPSGYDGSEEVPMVIMLHGTSGDGLKFYNISGWKEVGETETILTVFPTSWKYCIFDHTGDRKNTTKWNSQPADWTFCAGEVPRDDEKFLRRIITEMSQMYKVRSDKIYLVGFSNGGQMTAKCGITMSDVFAAVVYNAGGFDMDTTYTPKRRIPTTYQTGNIDWGPGNVGPEIALSRIDETITNVDFKAGRTISTTVNSFGLSNNYTLTGDTTYARIATFPSLDNDPDVFHRFVFVKGLNHVYPNGVNHPMKAAKEQWQWLKQF